MTVPGIVEDELGGEELLTRVSLSGDDELFVTPERTVVYRAGGVLSDESVEQFPHGVERLSVAEGRRKATVAFEYPVEDPRNLSVPKGDLEAVLQPVLASVLRAAGATDPEERFQQAFRFSELTIVVTSDRLFKHVGSALWDGEYDDYHFEDVSNVEYEPGDVATGVVLTVDGRKERVKTPNDRLPEVRRCLESALFSYHDVSSAEELLAEAGDDDSTPADRVEDDSVVSFGGVDPIDAGTAPGTAERREEPVDTVGVTPEGSADPELDDAVASTDGDAADPGSEDGPEAATDTAESPATSGADGESGTTTDSDGTDDDDGDEDEAPVADTPFTQDVEPAPDEALREEVEELRAAVERQNELLQRQQRAIERLIEELREN